MINEASAAWKRGLNGRIPTQTDVLKHTLHIDMQFEGAWVFPK
jgi:hypothetical protein